MTIQSPQLRTPAEALTEAEIAAYDYTVAPIPVDTSLTVVEIAPKSSDSDEEDESDELIAAIVELEAKVIAMFPHQKDPTLAFDPYNAVLRNSTRCGIDDEYLLKHIYAKIDMDYTAINWKPREIPDIKKIKQVMYDIETEGLDPEVDSVIMVGVRLKGDYSDMPPKYLKYEAAARVGLLFVINNPAWDRTQRLPFGYQELQMPDTGETYGVFVCKSEKDMLRLSSQFVSDLNPAIVSMHNGYGFDCPFIAKRCKINGISSPITVVKATTPNGDYRPLYNTAATSVFGKSIEFDQCYWSTPNARGKIWNDGSFPQIIDTQHSSGQQNKLMSDMDNQRLKYLARDYIGGRASARRELTYTEMRHAWQSGDPFCWGEFIEYLVYDLQDQEIVTDYFLPNTWEQQRFMPLALQEILVASPAKKWNSIMLDYYKPLEGRRLTTKRNGTTATRTYRKPQIDPKLAYEGALSKVAPGMYRSWFKVDVASLYPSIMLLWKLFDAQKDPLGLCLYILQQARELRYVYKKAGNKAVDTALKVLLNGCLAYETLVTTDKGVFPIGELSGTTVNVLNRDRDWVPAEFKSHGTQEIWNLTLRNYGHTKTIRVTGNHRWLAATIGSINNAITKGRTPVYVEHVTENLKVGMRIPYQTAKRPDTNNDEYRNGIVHGIVYGDGTRTTSNRDIYSCLLINAKRLLSEHFNNASDVSVISKIGRIRDGNECIDIRFKSKVNMKSLPALSSSNSYLLGFIRGLIATDGCVKTFNGSLSISSDKQTSEFIEKIGDRLGFDIMRINLFAAIGSTSIIRGRTITLNKDNYETHFSTRCVEIDDLLLSVHRNRFSDYFGNKKRNNRNNWIISKIERTGDFEEVYCCVEPITHYFTLTGGILTGNCYGWMGTGGYVTNSIQNAALVTAYGRVLMRLMCAAAAPYAMMGEIDTDGCIVQQNYHTGPSDPECVAFTEELIASLENKSAELEAGKKLDEVIAELDYQRELLSEMCDESRSTPRVIHSPAFVHHKMQAILPDGIVLELENNYPKGVIYAPAAKNYIKWKSPDSKPDLKGIYRKRNRNVLQKSYVVEYVRRVAFEGMDSAEDYKNAVINGIRRLSKELAETNNEDVSSIEFLPSTITIDIPLNDVVFKQTIATSDKRFQRSGMGMPGEIIYFYCGTRREKWSKPSKDGSYKWKKVKDTDYFPVAVRMNDVTGKYELDLQDIPEDLDVDGLTLALNYHKYEFGFTSSCDAVAEVVAAGEARTSNEIEINVLKLPQWWHDENPRPEGAWQPPIAY